MTEQQELERLRQSRNDYKRKWYKAKQQQDHYKKQLEIADRERRKIHGSLGGFQ